MKGLIENIDKNMKEIAISVRQPWAYLVCARIKDVENRTWKCPEKYIGKRVYIHASKSQYKNPWDVLNKDQNELLLQRKEIIVGADLEYGAIIGSVRFVDCVINHDSIWAEKSGIGQDKQTNDWIKPIYNWVVADPVLFDEPIPNVKGKLSFWDCSQYIRSELDNDGNPIPEKK